MAKTMKDVSEPPMKVKFAAHLTCWLLGAGSLLPWNSILSAQDYYIHVFPRYHPSRVLTLMYPPFCLLTIGAFIYFEDKINNWIRIQVGYGLYVLCTLCIPILDLATHGQGGLVAFIGTCIMCMGFGIATAHVFGSMVGSLSPRFSQSFIAGMAASGVATSSLRLITKALCKSTGLRKGALTFFFVASIFELFCLVLYVHIFPFLQITKCEHDSTVSLSCKSMDLGQLEEARTKTVVGIGQIFRDNIDYAINLFLISALTLSIFPGFLAEDTGKHELGTWYIVLVVAMYNVGDFISRYIPTIDALRMRSRIGLTFACSARFLFVPLFYWASKFGGQGRVLALCLLLGATNGYLIVCILIQGPNGYKDVEKKTLGNILTFFITFGVLVGVVLDWCWLIGKGW